MNRQEYINTILEYIDGKSVKREIEKELTAHIDDREQYYRDIGYDDETAAQKAMEHMGSPEAAADGFAKVHEKSRRFTVILALLSLLSSVIAFIIFWPTLLASLLNEQAVGLGILEAVFLMYIIGLSVIGKRCNSRFICLVSVIDFIIIYGLYFWVSLSMNGPVLPVCSHIVFKLTCLLTLDFECLDAFYKMIRITVAPYLTYLSIAFYVAIFILLILVFISVCMLNRTNYGLRIKQFARIVFKVQKSTWIFIAATMLVFPFFSSDKYPGTTVKTSENANSLIIAQSDTRCPISEIPTEDILIIDLDNGWGVDILGFDDSSSNNDNLKNITILRDLYHGYINGGFVEQECGNKIKYSVYKTYVPCLLSKKYVYIEFFDGTSPEPYGESVTYETVYEFVSDSFDNWYAVDSIGEITAAVEEYNQIEIIIKKKSP